MYIIVIPTYLHVLYSQKSPLMVLFTRYDVVVVKVDMQYAIQYVHYDICHANCIILLCILVHMLLM